MSIYAENVDGLVSFLIARDEQKVSARLSQNKVMVF